ITASILVTSPGHESASLDFAAAAAQPSFSSRPMISGVPFVSVVVIISSPLSADGRQLLARRFRVADACRKLHINGVLGHPAEETLCSASVLSSSPAST